MDRDIYIQLINKGAADVIKVSDISKYNQGNNSSKISARSRFDFG